MRSHSFFRTLLVATAISATSLSSMFQDAYAQAPAQQKEQVPGFYRLAVGDFTVTALYDGYLQIDPALLHDISDEEKQQLLTRAYADAPGGIQTAVNAYLVDTGKELILVDTGAAKAFGPTLGFIAHNIHAAGYNTKDIRTILLTHLHPDHASGLLTPEGKALFPNATVFATQAESDYWLNKEEQAKAPEGRKPMFALSQAAIAPYKAANKFKTFKPGDALVDGVVAASSAGHTPGHTGYLFSSKGQDLLVWGDVVVSHAVQFPKPEASTEFDVDPSAAVATRKRVFAETAASRKLWVAGAHLPFPGIGHVRQEVIGYSWAPVEYSPLK